jgi:hypothetical protein
MIFRLLTVAFLFFGQVTSWTAPACHEVLLNVAVSSRSSFLADLSAAQTIRSSLRGEESVLVFEDLLNNPRFQTFLSENRITDPLQLTMANQDHILAAYFNWTFSQYRDPSQFDRLRRATMARELLRRGAGDADFAEVSARNRDRILADLQVPNTPEMRAAEQVIQQLEMLFVHNTNVDLDKRSAAVPLLSSRQLQEAGLGSGLNTKNAFNRDVLQTDDHVFFYIVFKNKTLPNPNTQSQYGKKSIHLNANYAARNAWISHFIMYPDSLLSFLQNNHPTQFQKLFEIVDRHFAKKLSDNGLSITLGNFIERDWQLLLREEQVALTEILGTLHTMDFTIPDFERVWRGHLLQQLARISYSNPIRFQELLGRLGTTEANKVVKELTGQVLGDKSFGFEVKVPVAVDQEGFTVQ